MANQQQPQQPHDKERREASPGREQQQQRPDQKQDGQRREQRQ